MWSASACVAMIILHVDRLKSMLRMSSMISSTRVKVADVDKNEFGAAVDEIDVHAQAPAGLVVHFDHVGEQIFAQACSHIKPRPVFIQAAKQVPDFGGRASRLSGFNRTPRDHRPARTQKTAGTPILRWAGLYEGRPI